MQIPPAQISREREKTTAPDFLDCSANNNDAMDAFILNKM
jgi:hypothetical protein